MYLGRVEKKILILLFTGVSLCFAQNSKQYFRLVQGAAKEWRNVNKYGLTRTVRLLEKKKLITLSRTKNGLVTAHPTGKGKEIASLARLAEMELPPLKKWDGKWRVVMFDIPEKQRRKRDLLRYCLKQWGFCRLQQSIFVSPKDCRDAIELLIATHLSRTSVRFIETKHLSFDYDLRKRFGFLL